MDFRIKCMLLLPIYLCIYYICCTLYLVERQSCHLFTHETVENRLLVAELCKAFTACAVRLLWCCLIFFCFAFVWLIKVLKLPHNPRTLHRTCLFIRAFCPTAVGTFFYLICLRCCLRSYLRLSIFINKTCESAICSRMFYCCSQVPMLNAYPANCVYIFHNGMISLK